MSGAQVLETRRLVLCEATAEDAEFLLALMNEPGWLEHIGNRDVRDLAAAERYAESRLAASYRENGFGLWIVRLRETNQPIGLCGLVRRGFLRGIDLGFALLREAEGQGYALEAAGACVDFARDQLRETELLAITGETNQRSRALLQKLGFEGGDPLRLPGSKQTVLLFSLGL